MALWNRTGNVCVGLTAADIMRTKVLTVSTETTVGELLTLLAQHYVSGAPVLGASDQVVGVVSSTDLAQLLWIEEASGGAVTDYYRDPEGAVTYVDSLRHSQITELLVRDVMTPYVIDVPKDAGVDHVARRMADSHIHRVLVTDGGRLLGVVSALDIVRLTADRSLRPADSL